MSDHNIGEKLLLVPRGSIGLEPMKLDMTKIYAAENRLREVATVTPLTAPELQATFNEAANEVSKYLSWIKYEELRGKKEFAKAKSRVIIDELPSKAKEAKDSGIKMNEDFRDALVARDTACSELQEKLNAVEAITALLEGKFWSLIRAFNAAGGNASHKSVSPLTNLNATPGQLSEVDGGFMGRPRY